MLTSPPFHRSRIDAHTTATAKCARERERTAALARAPRQLEISYDYGETPKPAVLYFTAQRTLAAAPLRGDPSEDASKEEDSGINVNPADPGRWMQQQNQEDQFQKEAIDLALALAVLYALVQALKTVL